MSGISKRAMAERRRSDSFYNYGSTVRKTEYEYTPERRTDERSVPSVTSPREPETEIMYAAEQTRIPFKALRNFVFIAVLFAIFAFVISGYASISAANLENQKLLKNIKELETDQEILELSLRQSRDLTVLQSRAEQLGYSFAESDQIRYVEIDVPEDVPAEEEPAGFNIFDLLDKIRSVFN